MWIIHINVPCTVYNSMYLLICMWTRALCTIYIDVLRGFPTRKTVICCMGRGMQCASYIGWVFLFMGRLK